jgi:formate-dependent phosphoribosylglycinamide formyltransferase (GAR transformylase)
MHRSHLSPATTELINRRRRSAERPSGSVCTCLYSTHNRLPAPVRAHPWVPAGFPVLLKASAGGGGKGMRVVREASQLVDAIDSGSPPSAIERVNVRWPVCGCG